MKKLDLKDTQLEDLSFLENVKFEKLEVLDLSRNNISNYNILGLLEKVNFKNLKILDLNDNRIINIPVLENVKN